MTKTGLENHGALDIVRPIHHRALAVMAIVAELREIRIEGDFLPS
jgi:hypothetical protein